MDPITHALIGGAIYKVSGGQASIFDPMFTASVLGAMAPDIDCIFKYWGQYVYQKNHRGMTHSILGLITLSIGITFINYLIYPNMNILNVFIFALLGCLSHTLTDILNSYGTRALWPIFKKKIALNVLMLFDPILAAILLAIILLDKKAMYACSMGLVIYILFRISCKFFISYRLSKMFNINIKRVKVLPSVLSLNKWHFIIRFNKYSMVGSKNLFRKKIFIIKRFYDIDNKGKQNAMSTQIGRFFQDFTPLFNVECQNIDGKNVYTFTDMRHYLLGHFVHHAFATFNENGVLKEQIFSPYSLSKKIYI
jgi:inner membrane protein